MNDNIEKQLTTYLLGRVIQPIDLQRYTDYQECKTIVLPTMKYAHILYLLYLEYASRCPDWKLSKDNPLSCLTFHNSMRGPFAYHAFYSADEIYPNIIKGNVPKLSDLKFSESAQKRLTKTMDVVKTEIVPLDGLDIEYALTSYHLPLHKRFPLVATPINMNEKNVYDEVCAYIKYRHELITPKKTK